MRMTTRSQGLENHMKYLLVSITGAFAIAIVLWYAFFESYVIKVFQQPNPGVRVIGLFAGVILMMFAMAAILFPIMTAHMRKMDAEHSGYQPSYKLISLLPSKILGFHEVEKIRLDTQPLLLGMAIGGARAMRINRMNDKIHDQRDNGVCEKCHAEWRETYEINGSNNYHPFIFVEQYKVWYFILPIWKKHLDTDAYCNQHIPAQYESSSTMHNKRFKHF